MHVSRNYNIWSTLFSFIHCIVYPIISYACYWYSICNSGFSVCCRPIYTYVSLDPEVFNCWTICISNHVNSVPSDATLLRWNIKRYINLFCITGDICMWHLYYPWLDCYNEARVYGFWWLYPWVIEFVLWHNPNVLLLNLDSWK